MSAERGHPDGRAGAA